MRVSPKPDPFWQTGDTYAANAPHRTGLAVVSRRGTNAAISVLGLSSQQVASFVITLLAAGFLSPAEYGVYVLATVFVELIIALTYTGYYHYLVTSEEDDSAVLSTMFWMMLGIGTAGGALLYAAAPALARVFDAPELAPVLRLFGLMQPFASAIGWASAALTRAGLMRRYFLALTAANLGGLITGATVLLLWQSLYALVAYRAMRMAIGLVMFALAVPQRPRLRLDRAMVRRASAYAAGLYGARLLAFVAHFGTDLVLGLVFSTAEAGLYRFANRLAAATVDIIGHPMRSYALARLGQAARTSTPLGPVLARLLAAGVFLMGGFAITIVILGAAATQTLFRPEYLAALGAFYALALRAASTSATHLVEPVFAARHNTRIAMGFDLGWAALMIAAIALCAPMGLVPLAWAQAGVGLLGAMAGLWVIGRWGRVPLRDALVRTGRALILLMGYGAALAGLWPMVQNALMPNDLGALASGFALALCLALPTTWAALRWNVLDMSIFE